MSDNWEYYIELWTVNTPTGDLVCASEEEADRMKADLLPFFPLVYHRKIEVPLQKRVKVPITSLADHFGT